MAEAEAYNILIYGGGAVGSIFGWRLAQSSRSRVSVVCRSNWDEVQRTGFHFRTALWGSGHFQPREVFKADAVAKANPSHRFDYIICANKITGNQEPMLKDLRALVHPDTTLVTAQNGMGVEASLQRAFEKNTILTAVCNIACSQVQPGRVEQTASIKRSAFLIGVHSSAKQNSAIDTLKRDTLVAMDPESFETTSQAEHERWRKLIFNAAINSTTALTGLDTHQLLCQPGAAELITQLADEAFQVGVASGIKLDQDMPTQVVEILRNSKPITPSTLQDARARRPMELAPIFGYLINQAAKVGTHVPHMSSVCSLLEKKNAAFVAERAAPAPSWRDFASIAESSGNIASFPVVLSAGAR